MKPNKKKCHYWKVLYQNFSGTYQSAWENIDRVFYDVEGKWNFPNKDADNQFLFIFRTKKQAEFFSERFSNTFVFKVEIGTLLTTYLSDSLEFPDGTLFCDKLRVIEKA